MFNFGFGGMGGMPGGFPHGHGGGGGRPSRPPADTNKFYDLLGVGKDANDNDIKKAYRKQAMVHHPDKGGDPEKFKEISKAYETLSNEQKRKLYDEYGEEGLEEGGGGGAGGMDIFDLFMGGGGGRGQRGPPQKKRGEDVIFPLTVTLEDLYNGCSKKLRLTKSVLCNPCSGKGTKNGAGESTCAGCKGQGVKLVVRQIGPGMIQQMQQKCSNCDGTGVFIAPANRCPTCTGSRVVKEKKNLEVFVEKGSKNGAKIVFKGEADEAPETIPGDVVVVVQMKDDDKAKFIRKGNDLVFKQDITLSEALTGFTLYIVHMDNRILKIVNDSSVIVPSAIKKVSNEGMPYYKSPINRGDLYIEFNIQFPANLLTKDSLAKAGIPVSAVRSVPSVKTNQLDIDMENPENNNKEAFIEEVVLSNVDPAFYNSHIKNSSNSHSAQDNEPKNQYDDEDDDEEGGQHHGGAQQCRAQ